MNMYKGKKVTEEHMVKQNGLEPEEAMKTTRSTSHCLPVRS